MADLDITASLNSDQFVTGLTRMQKEAQKTAASTERALSFISGGLKFGLIRQGLRIITAGSDRYAESLGDAEEASQRLSVQIEELEKKFGRLYYTIDLVGGLIAKQITSGAGSVLDALYRGFDELQNTVFDLAGSSRDEVAGQEARAKRQREAASRRDAARTGLGTLEKTVEDQSRPLKLSEFALDRLKIEEQIAAQLAEVDRLSAGLTEQEKRTLEVESLRQKIIDNQYAMIAKIETAEQDRTAEIQKQADEHRRQIEDQMRADAERVAKAHEALDINEQQNEIGLLRLRGLKDEADRQELILKYKRDIAEIDSNKDLTDAERAARKATLIRQQNEELQLRGLSPGEGRVSSIASGLAGTIALAGLFGGGASAVVEQKKTNRVLDASLKELQAIKVAIQGGSARFA